MKLFILSAFIAVAHCSVLLGSKKCTYGPSYWCSHLHNAKECNAVQHCMTTVWAKQKLGMAGAVGFDETCIDVVKVLEAVRKFADDDDQLLTRMSIGCTGLPVDKRTECKERMQHDREEVALLLKSSLPTIAVASALGFCSGFEDTSHQSVSLSGDYCVDCKNFFGDIREIFNNSEKQAVAFLKEEICSKMGPFEELCDQLVDTYSNMLFQIVYQQLNPDDICALLNFCSGHLEAVEKFRNTIAQHLSDNSTCEMCLIVFKDLQEALRDSTIQQAIEDELENKLCPLLPSTLSQQCKDYVSMYGPMVFQILVTELDPQSVCQLLKMCTTAQIPKLSIVSLGSKVTSVQAIAPKPVESSPVCALCEFVLEKLEGLITSNATEQEIVDALAKVCTILPETLRIECNSFVKEYGPMIIKLLIEEIAPNVVCTALQLCAYEKPQPVTILKPIKGEECLLCEAVIGYVNSALKDPNNEKSVEQLLDIACDKLPSFSKDMCKLLVAKYTPKIVALLAEYDDPVKICTDLGLCTAEAKDNKSQKPAAPLLFQPMSRIKRALVGSEKCTYGPSYWCASKSNAIRCNVLALCVQKYGMKIDA